MRKWWGSSVGVGMIERLSHDIFLAIDDIHAVLYVMASAAREVVNLLWSGIGRYGGNGVGVDFDDRREITPWADLGILFFLSVGNIECAFRFIYIDEYPNATTWWGNTIESYLPEIDALCECKPSDVGHAIADDDVVKARARREGRLIDLGHAVGDVDGGKTGTTIEGAVADAGHAVRDVDRGKVGTPDEGVRTDASQTVGYLELGY